MFLKFLSVFIGGGIGALLRFCVSVIAKKYFISPLLGTLFVNIAGCFFIGYIFGLTLNKVDIMPQTLKLFLSVGILGGLTTFSTLNIEVFELIKNGKIFSGLIYMILSCIIGLSFTYLGYYLSNINH